MSLAEAALRVPFAITDPLRIPAERYYDRTFFELEKEKLWYRSWQMACRLQEIPEPNDFVEYEICDQSVLVVRQADRSVKAYYNVCPHRATQLAKGSGSLHGGQITCPFHGWRWNIDGSTSFIYGAEGFSAENLKDDEIRLRECRSEIWGNAVWINLDPAAAPLMESLQPVADMLEELGIGNWRVKWWKETILDANWKMAHEAFMEGWHTMRTHPQLTMGYGEASPANFLQHKTYAAGHSSFEYADRASDFPTFDVMLESNRLLAEGLDAMVTDRDMVVLEKVRNSLRPGESIRDAVSREMRAYYDGAGIAVPAGLENHAMWWTGQIFAFPNTSYLPMFGNALAYRTRPYKNDPEKCRFEVWSLTPGPEAQPLTRAVVDGPHAKDDACNWPLIPLQDFSNIERQQKGLHALGFQGLRLATEWERAIGHMHQELDRKLAMP